MYPYLLDTEESTRIVQYPCTIHIAYNLDIFAKFFMNCDDLNIQQNLFPGIGS